MKKKIMAAVLCTSMLIPTACVNAETSEEKEFIPHVCSNACSNGNSGKFCNGR